MAHFAQLDDQSIVTRVLVISQDEINTGDWGDPASWYKTSYNTRGGVYYTPNTFPPVPDPDQSKAFRKNFASVGDTYDSGRDAFIEPKPYPSWVLDEFSCVWKAPVPYPEDGGQYDWDEATETWVLHTLQG